jgi:hypothetical protein
MKPGVVSHTHGDGQAQPVVILSKTGFARRSRRTIGYSLSLMRMNYDSCG